MKLLIDWSVLCHICWHKMASPDYVARTDIEQAEFARNIAATILYFQERFQPSETLFALDGKRYWRYEVFQKFYATHTRVYKRVVSEPDEKDPKKIYQKTIYYMVHDKKTYQLDWHEGMEKYLRTKLKKAEVHLFQVDIHNKDTVLVAPKEVPYEIMEMYPKYKGARKESKWDYTTTREEFKEMIVNIAKNLAHTFKCRCIQVESAEADDVAYAYNVLHPKEDLVFITTDSDWNQMFRKNTFLKIYNPMKMEWVDTNTEQAGINLAIKIISGDSSDGIPGLSPENAAALIGPKNAEKLVVEHGVPGIYDYLKDNIPEDYLKRNLRLIYLKNCPKKVRKAISEELAKEPKKPKEIHKMEEYGLEKADIVSTRAAAEEARESDLEEGIYEE